MGEEQLPSGGKIENKVLDDPILAYITAVVGVINIILLILLLLTYISSYRKLKSSFSLGLVFFALLLILQNALFIFFLVTQDGFHGHGMGLPVLSINLIQLSALIVLLKVSNA